MNFKFLSSFALILALVASITFAGCAGGNKAVEEGAGEAATEAVEMTEESVEEGGDAVKMTEEAVEEGSDAVKMTEEAVEEGSDATEHHEGMDATEGHHEGMDATEEHHEGMAH